MTNIFDVAKLAGVSKSTVSRVFSGNGYVSENSREKILLAANELGYIPSILARQLRRQSTKTIAFIAKTYYPSVGELINYITHLIKKHGYNISVYFTKNKEDELRLLNLFKMHAYDGIYFVANRNEWSVIEKFAQYGPIVTWRRLYNQHIYSSYIDHYPLYKQILNYVLNKYGEVNIGHILNSKNKNNTKARIKAIKDISKKYRSLINGWQSFYPEQSRAGKNAAEKFITLKDKPQVIIAYSDYVAAEFISTLSDHGYEVPNNVKVFGFDNSDYGKYMQISTVDTFLKLQAENGINYIISRIENKKFQEINIIPKLVIRKTC
ncbi:LacI family DNA-binding transcriptional regulator [Pectinatus sottacetonis]|uniref:LacI family DNA-binding transcriptional regulator n=1 Tax=Pectinatus sottacetonis TaxID=1002795 RepID=UPI0018C712D3|nr:LacI family DNA-binding transcriptional regulator [Pectinatus sottacetonis]